MSLSEQQIVQNHSGLKNPALILLKLAITGACFWYISRRMDLADTARLAMASDLKWIALVVLILCCQIPLAGLRLHQIINAIDRKSVEAPLLKMTAISAIGIFFGQILPTMAGDVIRVWLLAKAEYGWRFAFVCIALDRIAGVLVLLALSFVILIYPSALAPLGGYRNQMLVILGSMLLVGFAGLILAPRISSLFARWPSLHEVGRLATAAHRALLSPSAPSVLAICLAIHGLAIAAIFLLGRAQGLSLSLSDAAVLFALMIGVAIVPVSISGWGLRELAVVSLLQWHGFPPEQALLFSVWFGFALLLASLPGAVVWVLYGRKEAKVGPTCKIP